MERIKHEWKISDNQEDTGKIGVRLECNAHPFALRPHYITTHPNLLEKYLSGNML